MTKYIFVTGGVVSSLGKGITAASLGRLLKARGLKVTMLKCDPYINVDPGTMNPYQHGEVFVTVDGAETDLDLGHYERYLDMDMTKHNNVTTGQIYDSVIQKERQGLFLGKTVQVIPHITNEIKNRFKKIAPGKDVVIVEVGGTVGDIESLPFLEAIRQMKRDVGSENVLYMHVTLIPYIKASEELKTKPTQHSVAQLRQIGIDPDIIICRTEQPLNSDIREKIGLFCNVPKDAVIEARDVASVYEVALAFHEEGLDELVLMLLRKQSRMRDLSEWISIVNKVKNPKHKLTIAVAGKYVEFKDAYKSIVESLTHGGLAHESRVQSRYVDVEDKDLDQQLADVDGILVPGGFGDRGIEGKIRVTKMARERNIPFFGICLGMQCAVVDYARHVLGYKDAHSTEFQPNTKHPVICLMNEQKEVSAKGGTMRLGVYPCQIKSGTRAAQAYAGKRVIQERHRHRYEVNNDFREELESKGLVISGVYTKKNLVEIIELPNHPWFLAVQFHPEFQSRPNRPHPLFASFIGAALQYHKQGRQQSRNNHHKETQSTKTDALPTLPVRK